MSPGNCDKKMNEFVTRSESRSVTAHGIFNKNRKKDILNEKYKDISIRDVHKWNRSTVSDKIKGNRKEIMEEILSKKGGPPDIALIDIETNSFLGCVEIKAFKAKNNYKE